MHRCQRPLLIPYTIEKIERIFNEMTIQFSLESVEYLAEKVNQCYSLPDEALGYLVTRISELISDLLQVKN